MLPRTLLAAAVSFSLGCSSTESSSPGGTQIPNPPVDASTGGTKDAGADATVIPMDATPGDIDAGQDANVAPEAAAPEAGLALPFFVGNEFVPSGYMGDSQPSMAAITMSHDASACKTPRQQGAGGDCFSITWAPKPAAGASAWAGVYWQSPPGNWGTKPGKPIPAGATKISFYAAGAAGGETLQVCAGGIGSQTTAYADTFSVKSPPITLTTTWTRYELSLQGASYTSVLGGFCWVASANAPTTSTFYIDDLRWE